MITANNIHRPLPPAARTAAFSNTNPLFNTPIIMAPITYPQCLYPTQRSATDNNCSDRIEFIAGASIGLRRIQPRRNNDATNSSECTSHCVHSYLYFSNIYAGKFCCCFISTDSINISSKLCLLRNENCKQHDHRSDPNRNWNTQQRCQ